MAVDFVVTNGSNSLSRTSPGSPGQSTSSVRPLDQRLISGDQAVEPPHGTTVVACTRHATRNLVILCPQTASGGSDRVHQMQEVIDLDQCAPSGRF